MRVLVIENYRDTGLGQIAPALEEVRAAIDRRRPHAGEALPTGAGEHDAVVVLGGGQNALDDELCPYFPALTDLLREFVSQDRAVLGVCLGSQLLARALGADNLLGATPEFGWRKVNLTVAGRQDPVLGRLPASFPTFHWHDDSFTLPTDAVRLAENATTANQAFRVGRAAYGVQFHFEADRQLVREWSAAFAEPIGRRYPGWQGRLEENALAHGPAADGAGRLLAQAWVSAI